MDGVRNPFTSMFNGISNWILASTQFVRDTVVPHQKHYPWYHQKFRRVPTIDECYTNDLVCMAEANSQFQRDKMVDDAILTILRDRIHECRVYYGHEDCDKYCADIVANYKQQAANWFSKYGDLPLVNVAKHALMKQKHRMIWERRHGPIGSGSKYVV